MGALSVKNVLSMVKNLGLNMNINEARVLVSTVDSNQDGIIQLDEFIDLIFKDMDDNDVMINLKEMKGKKP